MLNIGRMGPGRAGYYLTAVARGEDGVEGYYLARGEEPGRWLGHGAEQLGLSGEVTGPQLRAVLDARHPDTGEQLARHPARKVPGFDHTFRAPKSVSLLWALGDRETSAEVVAAHDAAVDAAIGYLQRSAGYSRRGAGGAETVPVEGFVAAAFRHRTSRADDPLLHTHVRLKLLHPRAGSRPGRACSYSPYTRNISGSTRPTATCRDSSPPRRPVLPLSAR